MLGIRDGETPQQNSATMTTTRISREYGLSKVPTRKILTMGAQLKRSM
jgi:hypothetical protein